MKKMVKQWVCNCSIAGFLWLIVVFSGCSLLFEPNETSISKIETYDQLVDATDGVYGQFREAVNSVDFYALNFNADDCYFNALGNPYRSYYGTGNDCLIHYYNFDRNYGYVSLYGVIASINNILTQFNLNEEDHQATKEILGELLFIRAYCYFRLTRSYGQVPLIDNPDISYTVLKPSFTEIYEFIEYDLLTAIQFLPENNSTSRVPYQTPHRGVVNALLAEVYLSWAGYPVKDATKYALAATTAAEVIDRAGFYGFNLQPDFANIWNSNGKYNDESVFSIYYGRSNNKHSIYNGYCEKRIANEFVIIINNGFSPDNQLFYNNLDFATEKNFYDEYPKGYRKEITFFSTIYVPNDGNIQYYQLDTGTISIDKVDPCSRVSFRKFYLDTLLIPQARNYFDSLSNIPSYQYDLYGNQKIYILRYAQTLLTYAEATARAGNLTDKAYECVNQIRRRAHHLDLNTPSEFDLPKGLSSEAFADSVVQERAWELAGETEGRWFDLLRLEKLDNVLSSVAPQEDDYFLRYKKLNGYFLAIPESDEELNPNLKQ